jgi:hypothetical protein
MISLPIQSLTSKNGWIRSKSQYTFDKVTQVYNGLPYQTFDVFWIIFTERRKEILAFLPSLKYPNVFTFFHGVEFHMAILSLAEVYSRLPTKTLYVA